MEVVGDRPCITHLVIIHHHMEAGMVMEVDIRVMIMDSALEMKDLAAETGLITAVREQDLIINYPTTVLTVQETRLTPAIMFIQETVRE
jgi:hypothetical protein